MFLWFRLNRRAEDNNQKYRGEVLPFGLNATRPRVI